MLSHHRKTQSTRTPTVAPEMDKVIAAWSNYNAAYRAFAQLCGQYYRIHGYKGLDGHICPREFMEAVEAAPLLYHPVLGEALIAVDASRESLSLIRTRIKRLPRRPQVDYYLSLAEFLKNKGTDCKKFRSHFDQFLRLARRGRCGLELRKKIS